MINIPSLRRGRESSEVAGGRGFCDTCWPEVRNLVAAREAHRPYARLSRPSSRTHGRVHNGVVSRPERLRSASRSTHNTRRAHTTGQPRTGDEVWVIGALCRLTHGGSSAKVQSGLTEIPHTGIG